MSNTLKNALLVFVGGGCYGAVIPLVRAGHSLGYSSTDLMAIQYLVALVALGLLVLLKMLKARTNKKRLQLRLKQMLQLVGVGIIAALVGLFYFNALAHLSSAAALALLFQFVWMGVLLQAIIERKLPNRFSALAALCILVGTLFAAGVLGSHEQPLSLLGVLFGLLSAVFYTAFLHFSGKVATDLPTSNRTFFTTVGSFLTTLCIAPTSFAKVELYTGFAFCGVLLGLIGLLIPVYLIQKGAPHISDGVTTIMASSELPSGIIMAALFMGDKVSLLEWVGVVVILSGIVLSQWRSIFAQRE